VRLLIDQLANMPLLHASDVYHGNGLTTICATLRSGHLEGCKAILREGCSHRPVDGLLGEADTITAELASMLHFTEYRTDGSITSSRNTGIRSTTLDLAPHGAKEDGQDEHAIVTRYPEEG